MDERAAVDELGRLLARDGERDHYFDDQRDRFIHELTLVARFHGGGRILEVGSFPGYFTWCLKRLGYDAASVDIDPSRNAGFHSAQGLTVLRCDVERARLPFETGRFRMAVCSEVFEHLRLDPVHALDEIHRTLEPGGVLLLQTPNLYSAGNVARFVSGRGVMPSARREFSKLRDVGHMGHIREYSRAEMREFLTGSGFEVIESGLLAHRPSHTGPITDLVYRLIPAFRPYQFWLARKPHTG